MSTRSPARLLRELGTHARKKLSQAFLTDEGVCLAMAEAAELGPSDEVLEIGPGLGILTRVLCARAGRVVAVELDRILAERLPELVARRNLQVVWGDALDIDPAQHFGDSYKLVANLPYQVTSPVLRRYLDEVRRPDLLVIMVQREVAERVTAGPGEASFLSMMVQSVADARLIRTVPPGAFFPRPRVTSAVLQIKPRAVPEVRPASRADFLQLVRAGFTQPRKTLANSLAQGLDRPRADLERHIVAAGLDPSLRPQHLTVAMWLGLLETGLRPA